MGLEFPKVGEAAERDDVEAGLTVIAEARTGQGVSQEMSLLLLAGWPGIEPELFRLSSNETSSSARKNRRHTDHTPAL